ncbi:DctP family TRAP transporter solute-binding subunit [Celeribacter persicus]|uniref:Tripartite ATP-independent transporter DctP family solute receptor n=1 Tax=Celeribacter persicus TaxID=1651082 RepID=A0A2T5H0G9_9RHOB|nr:DctP family TRAP transporter solute-binding subunit [Celeribacter persicus]PTQ65078.1 tripartite ATP-independent transporter DctP family solute receptor [Celeribacter persicus]
MKFIQIIAASAAAVALSVSALCAKPMEIRFQTTANTFDPFYQAMEMFRDRVDEEAPGAFDIKLFPSNSLYKQGTETVAMQRGQLEMNQSLTFDFSNQLPELSMFSLAYVVRDYDHMRAIFDGPIGDWYIKTVEEKLGITILATTYMGTRELSLAEPREVKTPEDLDGLKIRLGNSREWLLLGKVLGVSAVPLGMPEVYMAIKTGTVDGQENPLGIISSFKINEVSKQIVMTDHFVFTTFFAISTETFNEMTPEHQQIFRDAAQEAARWQDETRLADEARIREEFIAQGIEITVPDVEVFRKRAAEVYAEENLEEDWPEGLFDRVSATASAAPAE